MASRYNGGGQIRPVIHPESSVESNAYAKKRLIAEVVGRWDWTLREGAACMLGRATAFLLASRRRSHTKHLSK
jgi:hypothetical protein